ncbi:cytochrome bd oxidase small subunit CydS [Paenibacillus rhizovicinus]
MLEKFLIFVAPFLVVALSVGFLFWWGARKPKPNQPL